MRSASRQRKPERIQGHEYHRVFQARCGKLLPVSRELDPIARTAKRMGAEKPIRGSGVRVSVSEKAKPLLLRDFAKCKGLFGRRRQPSKNSSNAATEVKLNPLHGLSRTAWNISTQMCFRSIPSQKRPMAKIFFQLLEY